MGSWIGVSETPRRTQNRLAEKLEPSRPEMKWDEFENEPDTDWALPQNSHRAEQIVARQENEVGSIPLIIGGDDLFAGASGYGHCFDPSRPCEVLARYRIATLEQIDRAVACAKAAPDGWRSLPFEQRSAILGATAAELRHARSKLIRAAVANTGKVVSEADPEVSEAVDFVEFYRASARLFQEMAQLDVTGRGIFAVISPWNFPIAIPCGGMAAALAAGNTVILKPASDSVMVAWELCQCFWRAGVSKRVLQFVPCPGNGPGARLVSHPDVAGVILTGGTTTALRMLQSRSDLRLFAETGGKNATIVTALSDRELAIKHVVHSAFSHGGQKCSATSLLLLEAEVYDDPEFKSKLCDAVESLRVGSAWRLSTQIGPLIRPPSGDLEAALKTLEPGETWAVMPRQEGDNPNLWSPGVKYGVQPGTVTHRMEFTATGTWAREPGKDAVNRSDTTR